MNIFGWNVDIAVQGLFLAISYGLFLGFLMGLIRYLFIHVFERKEVS